MYLVAKIGFETTRTAFARPLATRRRGPALPRVFEDNASFAEKIMRLSPRTSASKCGFQISQITYSDHVPNNLPITCRTSGSTNSVMKRRSSRIGSWAAGPWSRDPWLDSWSMSLTRFLAAVQGTYLVSRQRQNNCLLQQTVSPPYPRKIKRLRNEILETIFGILSCLLDACVPRGLLLTIQNLFFSFSIP
jgi:hypothetical protein